MSEREHIKPYEHGEENTSSQCTATLAHLLLFTDPITLERLTVVEEPSTVNGSGYTLVVGTADGSRKWRHTIKTEEV